MNDAWKLEKLKLNWKNLNLCSKDYILRNCFPRRHLREIWKLLNNLKMLFRKLNFSYFLRPSIIHFILR